MFKKKPKVAVIDLDDCIFDFIGHLLVIGKNLYNLNYKYSGMTNWDLPKDLNEVFLKHENSIYLSQPVLEGVKDKINSLKEKGYKIFFMTARDKKFKEATEFSLLFNNIPYDKLFFNKNKALKINNLAKEYSIKLFVDDKVETVNEVKKLTSVKNVYLMNMPSNLHKEISRGIKRIDSLQEVEE
jgi:uncharacterized HAD superfamily protein